MTNKRRKVLDCLSILLCLLIVGLSGCRPTADVATFFQDLSREALAAFLL